MELRLMLIPCTWLVFLSIQGEGPSLSSKSVLLESVREDCLANLLALIGWAWAGAVELAERLAGLRSDVEDAADALEDAADEEARVGERTVVDEAAAAGGAEGN